MDGYSFSKDEFDGRVQRLRAEMAGRGLDAVLLTRGENIFYATGFRASHFASWLSELHAVFVPLHGEPRLFTRALEREIAQLQWTPSPTLYMDHENPYGFLEELARAEGVASGRLGIEERFLKVSQLKKIQAVLPGATLVDCSGLVEAIAARPSAAESACLRQAARITNIGFEAGIAAVRAGVFPYQVIGRMHEAMYDAGQRDFDMSLVCVWSGPKGGRMHDTATTERIEPGHVLTLEVWGVDNHYKAGAQGSLFVGAAPPADMVRAYDLVSDMRAKAAAAVRPGVSADSIFQAANGPYKATRGKDYYRRCGGSMGLTIFTVDLARGRQDTLVPGMALLVQTLVDDPVLLTCANTVMVTETGCEDLTKPLPRLVTVA